MSHLPRWISRLTIALLALGGVLPLLVYWALLGVPTRTPKQVLRELNNLDAASTLVDVRPVEDYARLHVEGAVNSPLKTILAWKSGADLPSGVAGRPIYLMCDGGWDSVLAVRHLQKIGVGQVYSVRGGMQEWAKAAWRAPELNHTHFTGAGVEPYIPTRAMLPVEQMAQVIAGFAIKPLYMLVTLALVVLLWREKAHDLTALRWGLLAFLVGETFCYVNFIFFRDDSYLSEFLHSYGMVAGFAMIFYAALDGIDDRFLHINDLNKRCGALPVCLNCSRYSKMVCRARRIYQLLIPVLALLASLPLFADFSTAGASGSVFGYPYYYARFGVYQFYENRFLPLAAIACFAAAYLPLLLAKTSPLPRLTQIFLSAGLGALSFSLGRLALSRVFASGLMWFDFWEELTELIFVLAIGALLWLFRVALFPRGILGWLYPTPAAQR